MLRFCGFDLELVVDEVLVRTDWPSVCCARDLTGAQWLIAQTDVSSDRHDGRPVGLLRDRRLAPIAGLCLCHGRIGGGRRRSGSAPPIEVRPVSLWGRPSGVGRIGLWRAVACCVPAGMSG